jgi:multidrug efflux pump subunit AcrA (membrane-fusion protein)
VIKAMRQHSNKKVVYLRPKKKSFVSIRMLLILMIIGTMAFISNRYFHVKTCTVTKGVINESYFTDAIIIKNETPISSPTNGKLQLLVKPGERVRVGTPLFIITIDEKQKELYQKEIAEIEDKIVNLQDDIGSSSISLNLLNKSVESTTEKLKDATDSGEFDRVKSLKDELLRLTEEKQKILEYNESNINILEQQLKNLRKKELYMSQSSEQNLIKSLRNLVPH